MENIMQEIQQKFFVEPECAEAKAQIELNNQLLRNILNDEDRKLVLRLVDAEYLVRDEVSPAAFTCGFRVATEIYNAIYKNGMLAE